MRPALRAAVFPILVALAACHDRKGRERKGEPLFGPPAAPLTTTIARGRVSPVAVPDLPDWVMDGVENCYTDGLRTNPSQRGRMRVSFTPPPSDGPVSVVLDADGFIEADVIACTRSAFGSIHSYKDKRGRIQPALTAELELEPESQQVPGLPTATAVRAVLDERFADEGVVKVLRMEVAWVRHRRSFTTFLREFEYTVDLEFIRDGFEVRCFHNISWKAFRRERVGHTGTARCENIPRRKGDRAEDQSRMYFQLTRHGWEVEHDKIYYCGDTRCPRWF